MGLVSRKGMCDSKSLGEIMRKMGKEVDWRGRDAAGKRWNQLGVDCDCCIPADQPVQMSKVTVWPHLSLLLVWE